MSPNRNAPLWRRLFAMTYDALLVFSLMFGATALYQFVASRFTPPPDTTSLATELLIHDIQPVASGPLFSLYLWLVMSTFFIFFWTRSGQTLGMQAWRLKLENLDGSCLNWQQAVIRYGLAWVSALTLGLGYLWALFDPQRRCWHDIGSNSRVVLLPKPK